MTPLIWFINDEFYEAESRAPPSRSHCLAPCFSKNLSTGPKSRMVMLGLLWGTSCANK